MTATVTEAWQPDWSEEFDGDPAVPALQDDEPDTWEPVDLGPYLRGEVKRPEPTVGLARSDGLRLLYPGKEHSVIGEMESGKSWYCLACAVAELAAGNPVLYVHFEEADPSDTVERLQALGASNADILKLFRFVGPGQPVTPERMTRLLDPPPTLAILDGVNEGMSLHRQSARDEDGVAVFRRRLVKPCTRVGAAVLSADHVVKDPERRGRGPLGSIHKGNALSGSLIVLENAEPFGRGERGRSHVFVTKDRPGHLRRHGRPTKTPGKTFIGELVVDDTGKFNPWPELTFWAPADRAEGDQDAPGDAVSDERRGIDDDVLRVVREIIATGEQATGRAVRAKGPYGTDKTIDALERLVLDRRLTKQKGTRNAWIYTPTGPEDQSSDVDPAATGRRDRTGPEWSPIEGDQDHSGQDQSITGPERTAGPVRTTQDRSSGTGSRPVPEPLGTTQNRTTDIDEQGPTACPSCYGYSETPGKTCAKCKKKGKGNR